jgi:hypothetical protein
MNQRRIAMALAARVLSDLVAGIIINIKHFTHKIANF